jgi:hypothetical protein
MPHLTDNSSGPVWKEFAPLHQPASSAPPEVPEPQKNSDPYIRERGGCQFCKGKRFLRSGFRGSDIGSLFLLRYPVRCIRCRQRQFTDFLTASLALAAGSPVYSEQKKRENWGAWTSGSDREAAEALHALDLQSRNGSQNGNHSGNE